MAAVTRSGLGGVFVKLVCRRVVRWFWGSPWGVFCTVNKRSNKHTEQALKVSQEAVAWHAEMEWK